MNTVNPAALLRSLIVYAVCVPLAILVGCLLCNLDYTSLSVMAVGAAVLIFPLLIKWHYPLLVFSWAFPAVMFFLPTQPTFFMFMVVVSLCISIVERILDRNQPFVPASAVRWPLFALVAVIIVTAELTGGIGLRMLGGDTFGGKKYVSCFIGIASFFAITARPIPKKHANLYLLLFFAGGFFTVISDLSSYVPGPLHFIYRVIPASNSGMDEYGNVTTVEFGRTRLGSLAAAAGGVFLWMLARYGFRGCFLTGKLWRPIGMGLMFMSVLLGGYRNSIIGCLLLLGFLFCLEKIYRTGAVVVVIMAAILGGALLVPMASHLPYNFQRGLSFLPLDIDPFVREDAEGTSEWRLEIWRALLPQVPKYLLLGKGYSFSAQTFDQSMGANATFKNVIDAADNPLALSSDFHSGPLGIVIPFGIWGVLAWLWFWAAGFYVLWRNYRYGDPALIHINRYLFAWYIISIFLFVFVFGDPVGGMAGFGGMIGLSIAINHGVMRSRSFPKEKPATFPGGRPAFAGQPAYPALLGR